MTFDEYQKRAPTTAIFNKDPLMDKNYMGNGYCWRGGEVIEMEEK